MIFIKKKTDQQNFQLIGDENLYKNNQWNKRIIELIEKPYKYFARFAKFK